MSAFTAEVSEPSCWCALGTIVDATRIASGKLVIVDAIDDDAKPGELTPSPEHLHDLIDAGQ